MPPFSSVDPAKDSRSTREDTTYGKRTRKRGRSAASRCRARPSGIAGGWHRAAALIQALTPWGLRAVEVALQQEVTALAGPRYAHCDGPAVVRGGRQSGSIYLADQKLPITVPRVRDHATRNERGAVDHLCAAANASGPKMWGCFVRSRRAYRAVSTRPPPKRSRDVRVDQVQPAPRGRPRSIA